MNNDYNKMISKMRVTDYGICVRKAIDEHTFCDSIVITKEAFIEAYNKWIKEDNE